MMAACEICSGLHCYQKVNPKTNQLEFYNCPQYTGSESSIREDYERVRDIENTPTMQANVERLIHGRLLP